jgi:antirestriction protein
MKYKINPYLAYRKIGEFLYVVDSKTSMLYKFNETAEIVFECIKKCCDVDKIVEKIVSEYEVEESVARSDVEEIIKEMLEKNIIEVEK